MRTSKLTTIDALAEAGLVCNDDRPTLNDIAERYAVAVPEKLLTVQPVPSNALVRQFVPDTRERQTHPFDNRDPIGDGTHSPTPGIVHRYRNRVLLKIVQVCPVYCRFCFRREMLGPGHGATLSASDLDEAINYIDRHEDIEEVIMTGGDPLILSPRRISALTVRLSGVTHVRRLRWHSRVPILQPDLVTDETVAALTNTSKIVRIAVHANHAEEFTSQAHGACNRLVTANVKLLSQSVLLAGVNDSAGSLADLNDAFLTAGIEPYYLHQLDTAPGTHHFRVPIQTGLSLLALLQRFRPGDPTPRYMLDIPGGFGKINLASCNIRHVARRRDGDLFRVRDPNGQVHIYFDPAPARA